MKIVVFDLDETLGCFTQFGIFYDSLLNYLHVNQLNDSDFDKLLDLYPEFLRPNIVPILAYLKGKKQSKCCHKVMIYTNNNGPKSWAKQIVGYFERKLRFKLIDQIIAAFKINGTSVEICRTTHHKTYKDLITCTKIPENAEICFMDDSYYPDMAHENIYYINIKPYYHDLSFSDMIRIFMNSPIGKTMVDTNDTAIFQTTMTNHIDLFHYKVVEKNDKEYEIDQVLGKHIIYHLHTFFKSSHKKTQKNTRHKYTKSKSYKNMHH